MNRRINIITMLIIILAVLIVFAGLAAASLLDIYNTVKTDPESAFIAQSTPLVLESSVVPSSSTAPAVVAHDLEYNGGYYNKNMHSINIVLLGFDDVEDRADDGGNTDSLMVFQIDFDSAEVNVISIPRDTWTLISEYDSDGELEYTYHTKINAAYSAAARSKDRYPNVLSTIENLFNMEGQFDLDMDYYCSIDIKDVPEITKVVGGVSVTLAYTIPGVGDAGETVMLDEDTCEIYLRDRSTGDGDITRAQRHQKFMIALAKRIQALGGKKAALTLYDDAVRYTETNLSLEQIAALASLMDQVDVDDIALYTVPGAVGSATYERPGSHYGDFRSVYLVDESALAELIISLYYEPVSE